MAVLGLFVPTAAAQGNTPQLAYVNSGGQLVIASADGAARWVVTNPNEALVNSAALAWSPNGQQLFFAVNTGSGVSARAANIRSQSVTELGIVNGNVSGGEWASNNNEVIFNNSGGIVSATNGSANVLVAGGQLTSGQALSQDGRFLFYHNGNGYSLAAANGSNAATLPGRNDATAAGVGLWTDSGAVVAYWTYTNNGTAALNVTNAANGQTLTIDSGTSVPITPLAWLPNSQTLLYRSAAGVIAVDASCVRNGCNDNPAQTAVLPVTAANVTVTTSGVMIFTGNGAVFGVDVQCVRNGNCANNAVSAGSTASNARVVAAGRIAAFTGANGTVNALNLNCVSSGECSPTALGISGNVLSIAPNGGHVIVSSGATMNVIDLSNPAAVVALSGVGGNSALVWNG
jgi:hypothetical protein